MTTFELDLTLVVPVYNEDESLPELEAWISRVCERERLSYEILLIDDGSTDQSWAVIETLSERNPAVRGLRFRRNQGKSAALNAGFERARGEVVITMDADLQDSPDEIPGLVQMIREQNFDLVSGWKQTRHDPLSKTIPSKFFNRVTRRISHIELNDFNCGLKAYRNEVVKNIDVYGEMHRYIPLLAKWAGFGRIGEKVVEHRARKYGVTKFGLERFLNGFLDLLTITFVGKFGKRPMHFFGTWGSLAFTVGLVILLYLTLGKLFWSMYGIADRPLFYFGIVLLIVGTQLFVTGFLAELIIRSRPEKHSFQVAEDTGSGEIYTDALQQDLLATAQAGEHPPADQTRPLMTRERSPGGWTLFLDRDGVLNERLVGDYVRRPEQFVWLPGVLTALKLLSPYFDRRIIVTNQQGIGKGLMSEADLANVHRLAH